MARRCQFTHEMHALLAADRGEVLEGVGRGLAAERDEEAQARQGPLALVVRAPQRDAPAAEDAAGRDLGGCD